MSEWEEIEVVGLCGVNGGEGVWGGGGGEGAGEGVWEVGKRSKQWGLCGVNGGGGSGTKGKSR